MTQTTNTSEPVEVLSAYGRGSSGIGITTLLRACRGCAREITLEKAYPEVPGRLQTMEAVAVGTLVHRRLEGYYSRVPLVEPAFDLSTDSKLARKADAIYSQYIARHPRNEWGRIISVESELPANPRHKKVIAEAIFSGYTCKYDLVIKPTPKVCETQLRNYGLLLDPTHYYIVDHKIVSWFSPKWDEPYQGSIQAWTYMLAFKAAHPRRKLGGVIINAVSQTKDSTTRRTLVTPDTIDQELCEWAWDTGRLRMLHEHPNFECCYYPAASPCPFLRHPACNRKLNPSYRGEE